MVVSVCMGVAEATVLHTHIDGYTENARGVVGLFTHSQAKNYLEGLFDVLDIVVMLHRRGTKNVLIFNGFFRLTTKKCDKKNAVCGVKLGMVAGAWMPSMIYSGRLAGEKP